MAQIETDKLDFRLRCDLSRYTRDFGFYTGSSMETDKYIEVLDKHFIVAKQTVEVQI